MKVTYDPDSGAAYIRLRNRTIVETEEIAPGVLMDLAEDGRPVGFDILDAAAVMDAPARQPIVSARPTRPPRKGVLPEEVTYRPGRGGTARGLSFKVLGTKATARRVQPAGSTRTVPRPRRAASMRSNRGSVR